MNTLSNIDCLIGMDSIPDKSIDAIICDLPYGTTACAWDVVIPFDKLWSHYNRIIKDNGGIALFGSEPFSSSLRLSNRDSFKYDWVWIKNKGSNFLNAKRQPMKEHEIISVFYKKQPSFYPIKQERSEAGKLWRKRAITSGKVKDDGVYGKTNIQTKFIPELRYPSSHQKFSVERGLHPTQKPVSLLEYLIKTYTRETETVLDFTLGSGSTGVACKNLNRKFIGIEKEKEYFDMATKRIKDAVY